MSAILADWSVCIKNKLLYFQINCFFRGFSFFSLLFTGCFQKVNLCLRTSPCDTVNLFEHMALHLSYSFNDKLGSEIKGICRFYCKDCNLQGLTFLFYRIRKSNLYLRAERHSRFNDAQRN